MAWPYSSQSTDLRVGNVGAGLCSLLGLFVPCCWEGIWPGISCDRSTREIGLCAFANTYLLRTCRLTSKGIRAITPALSNKRLQQSDRGSQILTALPTAPPFAHPNAGLQAEFEWDGFASEVGNHSWTGSVQGAVATWLKLGVKNH